MLSPRRFFLAVAPIVIACNAAVAPPPPPGAHRFLFIGNSLTYANNLPDMVRVLADSAGLGTFVTAQVALPNYSLEDHWNDGTAAAAIASDHWDVVVLQQGPSSLAASRTNLIEYAQKFAALIRANGAVPAMYMVWPESARFGVFDDVRESYRVAAESIGGVFLPAGEAWRAAWRRNGQLALYDTDKFHPSVEGTYLAALLMVRRLLGRSLLSLPTQFAIPRGPSVNLDTATARIFREAAIEADSVNH